MRRSGQPSRPRARICCLLSSPKMLAIPAGNHALHRRVNVLGRRYFTGRFSGVHDWPVLGVHRGGQTRDSTVKFAPWFEAALLDALRTTGRTDVGDRAHRKQSERAVTMSLKLCRNFLDDFDAVGAVAVDGDNVVGDINQEG